MQELIATAKNESLSNMIEDLIDEQESEEETSCIKILICKITPFIVKMQNTIFGTNETYNNYENKIYRGASIMYRHLPSSEEINARSEVCENKYPKCDLNN